MLTPLLHFSLETTLKDNVNYGHVLHGWFPYVSMMITDIYNVVTVVKYTVQAVVEAKDGRYYPVPIQNGFSTSDLEFTTEVVNSHNPGNLKGVTGIP